MFGEMILFDPMGVKGLWYGFAKAAINKDTYTIGYLYGGQLGEASLVLIGEGAVKGVGKLPKLKGIVLGKVKSKFGGELKIKSGMGMNLQFFAKNPSKANSKIWSNLKAYKGSVKKSGVGRKTRYYEWDFTHNDIEVYDFNRRHLGSMDPTTGELYKPPVKGRRLN